MVLTGPGEEGEANAKKVMAANSEKTGPKALKPGEGPSKEEQESGLYDLLYVAVAPDGREVRISVKGDRDPGYGSTSKMISECAICLAARHARCASRFLDAGRGDAAQTDQAANRSRRPDICGGSPEHRARRSRRSSPGCAQ